MERDKDIQKWIDRFENLAEVSKDLCLQEIQATFNRSELIELLVLLHSMQEVQNGSR